MPKSVYGAVIISLLLSSVSAAAPRIANTYRLVMPDAHLFAGTAGLPMAVGYQGLEVNTGKVDDEAKIYSTIMQYAFTVLSKNLNIANQPIICVKTSTRFLSTPNYVKLLSSHVGVEDSFPGDTLRDAYNAAARKHLDSRIKVSGSVFRIRPADLEGPWSADSATTRECEKFEKFEFSQPALKGRLAFVWISRTDQCSSDTRRFLLKMDGPRWTIVGYRQDDNQAADFGCPLRRNNSKITIEPSFIKVSREK